VSLCHGGDDDNKMMMMIESQLQSPTGTQEKVFICSDKILILYQGKGVGRFGMWWTHASRKSHNNKGRLTCHLSSSGIKERMTDRTKKQKYMV
jgi:hypothetical protein